MRFSWTWQCRGRGSEESGEVNFPNLLLLKLHSEFHTRLYDLIPPWNGLVGIVYLTYILNSRSNHLPGSFARLSL